MDTQQVIAPPRAQPGTPGTRPDVTPTSGVLHVNARHTTGFTVIGNHLAQHRKLSLLAIGLAAHIQSLPAGANIGIKALAARFPESETRIAAALRELEATGYLHRSRVRLPNGRIATRTTSYNHPGADAPPVTVTPPQRPRPQAPTKPEPTPAPAPPPPPVAEPALPLPAPVRVPPPTAPRTPPAPLPQPHAPTEELLRTAAAVLTDLRRHAPQLTLRPQDIEELTPGVAAWLERDAHPDTIRHALTNQLPDPVKHPAKFVRNRITTLLPPPLPGTADLTPPPRRKTIVIPLQNCDTCDRAYRATHPGHCRDCRTEAHSDLHTAA
ncbi:helix-turn-helix domain-containing protein [Streptomyces sp. NPDC005776]|uniref:helix-turn-helix domain-containing protein n=1 Tax=Streptomyces sp. NPDC005776 TaxID=3154676 RepID=UPI0033F75CC1